MIILINGKKAFDRIQHSYMAKTLSKQGNFFDLIKNKKSVAKLIFPLDIWDNERMLTVITSVQCNIAVPSQCNKARKRKA